MFEEECANAFPLIRISDSKRHLGTRGGLVALVEPKIAAYADDVFLVALPERGNERHVPRAVKLSKIAQLFIRQSLFGLEKAKINGAAAQALKEGSQALLVVRPDRP